MRYLTLIDLIDGLLNGGTYCYYPKQCGLCGQKTIGVPLLFWVMPCEKFHCCESLEQQKTKYPHAFK